MPQRVTYPIQRFMQLEVNGPGNITTKPHNGEHYDFIFQTSIQIPF